MVSVAAQAVGMARSQGLFWGCYVGLWHMCCQEVPRPAQAPQQLCKECPRAGVAACQALPRHIPEFRAPSSTGDSQPHASDGVRAVLQAQQPPAGRSIPAPQGRMR